MPTYEFLCESCGKEFEVTLSLSERAQAKIKCPGCESERVTPQMAVFTAKTSRKS